MSAARFILLQFGKDCPQCIKPTRTDFEKETLKVLSRCGYCGRAWAFDGRLSEKAQARLDKLRARYQQPPAAETGAGL